MKRKLFSTVFSVLAVFVFSVQACAVRMLVPVGEVVGLSLAEGSVTVVAYDESLGGNARSAGIRIGDEIVSIDGRIIDSVSDLHEALKVSDGSVVVCLNREGREHQLKLCPAVTSDGPRLGVCVREGVTGIGTVTYYDPEEECFGALGHGISDCRGRLAMMRWGNVYSATVAGVRPGKAGSPGQLKGSVDPLEPIGALEANTPFGVFGTGAAWTGEALPMAEPGQVDLGPAQILSNVSGDAVEVFRVEITKLYPADSGTGRDMMLKVTDPDLLNTTGGIVAGMSGSPIIQDGRLVGAVTHVLVNDPCTGYGIFIENMLDAAG